MTHRLTTNCAKKYCNRTLIVKVIVENVVTCFLGEHGVCVCDLYAACESAKRPSVLWSLYFNVDNTSRRDLSSSVDNILLVSGPDELIDYDHAIAEVQSLLCCRTCCSNIDTTSQWSQLNHTETSVASEFGVIHNYTCLCC